MYVRRYSLLLGVVGFLATGSVSAGEIEGGVIVWQLGVDDTSTAEFSQENGAPNDPPGSPEALDDDFYFAGDYIDTLGLFLEVDEPLANVERAVTDGDPDVRIHFIMEDEPDDVFRLTLDTVGNNSVPIPITVEWNGTEVIFGSVRLEEQAFEAIFRSEDIDFLEGENVITFSKADSDLGTGGWVQLDRVTLELFSDTDADGLPDAWEQQFFPGDLTQLTGDGDTDGDGLTEKGEVAADTDPTVADSDGDGLEDGVETKTGTFVSAADTGTDPTDPDTDADGLADGDEVTNDPATDPTVADTDDDGLSDSEEINGMPPTNPTLADTDGDGSSDGEEVRDGTDPTDPNDVQLWDLVWNLGLDDETQAEFSQENTPNDPPGSPDTLDDDYYFAGLYDAFGDVAVDEDPFNMERAIAPWDPRVRVHFIFEEQPENLALFRLTVDTIINNGTLPITGSFNGNELFSGEVANSADAAFVTVFTATKVGAVEGENVVTIETADQGSGWIQFDHILLEETTVPANDQDVDGIPDDYEEQFFPGDLTQLSEDGDFDNDRLDDVDEFRAGTNPTLADTDGDGLFDGFETNTGVYVSQNDTGTDPLSNDSDGDTLEDLEELRGDPPSDPNLPDTDGDGIDDNDELAADPPTNPTLADTDGDGVDDLEELQGGSDPTNPDSVPPDFELVWQLGVDDDGTGEFSQENGLSNDPPGGADILDDDYYFAGEYDLAGVIFEDEPLINFERAVTGTDPRTRIHFILEETPSPRDLYRLTLNTISNCITTCEFAADGPVPFSLAWNDNEVFSETIATDEDRTMVALFTSTAAAGGGTLQDGEHVVTIERGGMGGWIQFDLVRLEVAETTGGPIFKRGDSNANGTLDIGDPILNLGHQFLGDPVRCRDALDYNDTNTIDISDPIANLTHQFLGGPPPASPGKESCGPDGTEDTVDCADYPLDNC